MNSAKDCEDEMRHTLLQISARGVQIACIGRYLNSFRGVCGPLVWCVSEATLVFDLTLTSVVHQTWVETLLESHHTGRCWTCGRVAVESNKPKHCEETMHCKTGCVPRWRGSIRTAG